MAQLKDLLVNGKSKFLDMITAVGMKLSTGGSDTTFWNTNGGVVDLTTTTALSKYLPLTGGTLTGKLTISSSTFGHQLVLNRPSDGGTWGPSIIFQNADSFAGSLGVDTSGVLYFGDNGINKYKIWHANNDGTGSGLDADLLDGQHGSYYMPASKKYWANIELGTSASTTTEPTFKTTTIQNDSTHRCVMSYDSTEECMKFTFA